MRYLSLIWIAWMSFFATTARAQKENAVIRKGNRLYKEQKFEESEKQYRQALDQSPDNPAASYNMGNAQFRKNSFQDAAKSYDLASSHANDPATKEQSYYNKGVASVKQQKLPESIAAWKDALKLDPADEQARDNLEKALMEQKKNQQQQNKDNKKDDNKQQDKKQNKDQQKQDRGPNQQPPQQPKSRLTKQQVDQLLKALQQKEKDVQDKMNQNRVRSLSQPEKDW